MESRTFFTQLLLVTLGVIVMIVLLGMIPALSPYTDLSWVTCSFFVVVSIIMYFFGFQAANSESKYAFSNIIFGFMFGKMILTVALVMGYNTFMQPTTKLFLIPFFMIYFVYSIFEAFFMMKLGKMNVK